MRVCVCVCFVDFKLIPHPEMWLKKSRMKNSTFYWVEIHRQPCTNISHDTKINEFFSYVCIGLFEYIVRMVNGVLSFPLLFSLWLCMCLIGVLYANTYTMRHRQHHRSNTQNQNIWQQEQFEITTKNEQCNNYNEHTKTQRKKKQIKLRESTSWTS